MSPRPPRAERLQKVIARSGLASRRVADSMILAGRVIVDGKTALPGQKVDPVHAEVMVDGLPLPVHPDLVYYLLHKPLGVISTTVDPHGRTPVVDLVPSFPKVYPVGRLDADSTGLLLLTNDGSFTNLTAHPSSGITKTYEVLVRGSLSRADLSLLRRGIELEDGPAVPVAVRKIGAAGGRSHLELTMAEGRNREVRRLCAAAGYPVMRLHRVAIGTLRDHGLKPGEWRNLEVGEVRAFHREAGECPVGPIAGNELPDRGVASQPTLVLASTLPGRTGKLIKRGGPDEHLRGQAAHGCRPDGQASGLQEHHQPSPDRRCPCRR